MTHETIQRSALLTPNSWNEETKTAEIVISTDQIVGDGWKLSHDPGSIVMPTRPIPIDIEHSKHSATVWGSVKDLRIERNNNGVQELIGKIAVDGPPDAVAIALPRLRNGSARFSVEARYTQDQLTPSGSIVRVNMWEPIMVSLVAAPQDPGAIMRSSNSPQSPPGPDMANDDKTPDPVQAQETAPVAPPAPEAATIQRSAGPAPATVEAPPQMAAADALELTVRRAAGAAGLGEDAITGIIERSLGRDSQFALMEVIRATRERLEAASPVHAGHPAVTVTRDEGDTIMRGLTQAMEYRCGLTKSLDGEGLQFRGYSARELCRAALENRGVVTRGMGINELIARAFHSTSDMSNITAAVVNKSLRAAYDEEPSTWEVLSTRGDLPDFKKATEVQMSASMVPQPLQEGGSYKATTMQDGSGTWNLVTYAISISLTRQMIINDDLNAFGEIPTKLGSGARIMQSNIVWDLLLSGASGAKTMDDNKEVFHVDHNNTISGANTVISIAGMDLARQKLGLQKDPSGNRLNLRPAYLIVPQALATTAEQFLNPLNFAPNTVTGDNATNVFARSVTQITEARLDDDSSKMWYLAASPSRVPMLRHGYLSGEPGPTITTEEKRDPDVFKYLMRIDYGAAVRSHLGFVRSKGEA